MKTLALTYDEKSPRVKKMLDDLLANSEIGVLEIAKDPFSCSDVSFYSEKFEEKWEKGIPVEQARQMLLKKVRSWGLPSKKSL
jgi:hypothetical protein